MKTNYHSHTSRCFHATGLDEEYVLEAIKNNYDVIGFSDHMPVPGIEVEKWFKARMGYSKRQEYVNSVLSLKEKYKDQIRIMLAYECEYFEELDSYYEELLNNEAEYLVFGNHFMYYKEGEYITNIPEEMGSLKYLKQYEEKAIKAIKSGYFKIMAHPDFYLKYCGFSKEAKECAYKICKAAKEADVYLEINEMCFRRDGKTLIDNEVRYGYPTKFFFEVAKEIGNKFIIGVDAHNPSDYSSTSHQMAIDFANEMGLEVYDHVEF